jgi:hypothetical protein
MGSARVAHRVKLETSCILRTVTWLQLFTKVVQLTPSAQSMQLARHLIQIIGEHLRVNSAAKS